MGISHEIVTDLRRYRVVTDTHLLLNVFVWGRVIDAVRGTVPGRQLTVTTNLRNAVGRQIEDGLWCIAGDPLRSFDDLAVINTFTAELNISGYRTETVTVTVPANPVWPIAAGTQGLRPFPVRVQGRVTAKATGLPVANGRVIAVDPPAGPPPAPRPFLLRSCLKQAHSAAASVRGITLAPVALAPARVLEQEAMPGSTVITVNNRTGFAATQVIQFRND